MRLRATLETLEGVFPTVNDMVWADAMAREVLRLRGPAEGLWRPWFGCCIIAA